MRICNLVYELYKLDWMNRISIDTRRNAVKDYYENLIDKTECSFDDYIEEFGYDGELYACFEEFCDNEYRDKHYIKKLLNDDKLYADYEKSLEQKSFCPEFSQ